MIADLMMIIMIADLLTKALPVPRISDLREMFKLKVIKIDVEEEC